MTSAAFHTTVVRASQAALSRARAEIESLASIAGNPWQGVPLLTELGVGSQHFTQEDTLAIYLAIEWGASIDPRLPTHDVKPRIVRMAWELLKHQHCADEHDRRRHGTGMRWGLPRLCQLFIAVDYNSDLVRMAARKLLRFDCNISGNDLAAGCPMQCIRSRSR